MPTIGIRISPPKASKQRCIYRNAGSGLQIGCIFGLCPLGEGSCLVEQKQGANFTQSRLGFECLIQCFALWLQLIFIGLVRSTGSEPLLGLKLFGWTAV